MTERPADTAPSDPRAELVFDNPWARLRAFTDARIALGRAGVSLPTERLLAFQLAHAQARDAVHEPLDVAALSGALGAIESPLLVDTPLTLHSRAADRTMYLQRPDLGRQLNDESRERLWEAADRCDAACDLAIVVADGLSSRAVAGHAVTFVAALAEALFADAHDWRLAPLCVVEQGRVAIADAIGAALGAQAVLMVIGERPGLSSPDSLGLYLTRAPSADTTDADRNCISNIRPAGLAPAAAARRLLYLLTEARRLGLTGIGLKDRSDDSAINTRRRGTDRNFLVR